MRPNFNDQFYVQSVKTAVDAAATNTQLPASGSFIDASLFQRFVFLIALGTIADALVFKVRQATAKDGTLKDITGATYTITATDDGNWLSIEVETARLDINNKYRFVALDVSGVSGSNYIGAFFLGYNPGLAPVTQPTGYEAAVVVAG